MFRNGTIFYIITEHPLAGNKESQITGNRSYLGSRTFQLSYIPAYFHFLNLWIGLIDTY